MAQKRTAGAFDIRNIIGALIGIYGVILLVMGLVFDPELDKTGGVNANLWTGVGLLVAALVFLGWARLRPIVVATPSSGEPDSSGGAHEYSEAPATAEPQPGDAAR